MLHIGILGIKGKMGQALLKAFPSFTDLRYCKGTLRPGAVYQGYTVSPHTLTYYAEEVFKTCDVILDFTGSDTTRQHLDYAEENKKPLLLGTTGFDVPSGYLQKISRSVPLLVAPNTSLGMAIFGKIIKQAALALGPDFQPHIHDSHHVHKKDSPSGTAQALGDLIASSSPRTVTYSSTREGHIIGNHQVSFKSPQEIFTFSHEALDRQLFAQGALKAAKWLGAQQTGLYTMMDMVKDV